MTNDNPAWETVGHANLDTGEVVTISVGADGRVALALYAMSKTGSADDTVTPAPVVAMLAAEAELVGGLLALGAATALSQRRPGGESSG
jgi:hypothetical protein